MTGDAIAADSPHEALFCSLFRLWRIPVEHTSRGQIIPVSGHGWYCPDFYLPGEDLWVEVKGCGDKDDRSRHAAWRATGCSLAVVLHEQLEVLRMTAQGSQAVAYLKDLAWQAAR